MPQFLNALALALFFIATIALAIYGIHLYVLLVLFRRRARDTRSRQRAVIDRFQTTADDASWPIVTSQIPLYNEMDVAEQVIRQVAAMDYPAGRHEIQVLDDSTDASRAVVDRVVAALRDTGIDIKTLRRNDRTGYKGGALAMGAESARGAFLAVFDADFMPPADFLRRAIPLLVDAPDLACLQGRWAHLNQEDSWLTRAQALGIDGHFAVEQGARAWNGLMMNFNGTAGVWRKEAIEDPRVGGWNGDTLTEDLDLSYRAQLGGWRIDYSFDLACPAELPRHINAFKSQQRRWATGSIQVAIKLLPGIWRAPLTLGQRVEATLHLTHYSVSVWMLLLAIVARPMLFIRLDNGLDVSRWFWAMWIVILSSAAAPAITYGYARYCLGGGWSGLRVIPQLMALGCGMCVNNTIAVVRGLCVRGGEFVRTPKSGNQAARNPCGSYAPVHTSMWAIELLLGVYSLVSFGYYISGEHWPVSVFLLLYGAGFLAVGWMSMPRPVPRPLPGASDAATAPAESSLGASATLAETVRT